MQLRQVFLHLLTPWHCCKVHCCRLLHSRSSLSSLNRFRFRYLPSNRCHNVSVGCIWPQSSFSSGENAGPLQQFWPWPCTDNYVWLCLLITLSPGSATSWASLFSLQPKQLSVACLFLLPMFPKGKVFVLTLWWFLSRFFSFQKTSGSDSRCLKVETPLVPGSKQLLHRWQLDLRCNIHDAAKR